MMQNNELMSAVSHPDMIKRKEAVEALEQAMLRHDNQIELNELRHFWSGDVYCRELFMPAGALVVGRIHKFDHMEIMVSGNVSLSTNDGSVEHLTGYNIFEAKAGKKRVLYMHEDTLWITCHSSPRYEPEFMMPYLSCATFDEFVEFQQQLLELTQGESE